MSDKRKRTSDNARIDERFHAVPVKRAAELREIPVRLDAHTIARLDDWITRQKGSLSRSEAIVALMNQALEVYDIANRTKRKCFNAYRHDRMHGACDRMLCDGVRGLDCTSSPRPLKAKSPARFRAPGSSFLATPLRGIQTLLPQMHEGKRISLSRTDETARPRWRRNRRRRARAARGDAGWRDSPLRPTRRRPGASRR